ncbi:secretion/DNA translocation related CpaE-like protein [Actinoplanes tereljensis]|uniref:Septum formation initiator n=1 Tax=Paractinoplanes tereljensis TaxID=571912 RepID=A0A919NKY2_9ACTN|nr:septum site-determining protein Ssd [Actinoplanes tereljensis]GIF19856.1 septum formation initiator [Actinoplanes tereljensis]
MSVPRLPLVVTADPDLLDDLLRLAAAGGTEVVVAADPVEARPRYAAAPLVVIGADQASACLRARLPRRSRVVVVGRRAWPPGAAEAIAELRPVEICLLPDGEPWLVDRFADGPGRPLGRILAVIGGTGGAGASILAGGLAVTAVSAGHRTLLVDADPLGGGLDLLLGWERIDGLRWPALAGGGGRVDPPTLLRALPHRGDLVLLSFARDEAPVVPGDAMAATLDAGRRGRDVIITDLPRQLDEAAVLALQSADRAVLIVPAELRATAGAARIAQTIRFHRDELSVVVRGPAPGKLKARDIAAALRLPLAGALRPEPAMCQAVERGAPPASTGKGPLAELCRRLIRDLMRERRAVA